MEIKNIRNLEVLNENPKVLYAEADYIGAKELEKVYGFIYTINGEKINVFNANAGQRIKDIFKKCCVRDALNPKQYKVIKVGVN